MEVGAVLQITEDVLALLGQHVVHHVSGNMDIFLRVFIVLSVGQLKSKVRGNDSDFLYNFGFWSKRSQHNLSYVSWI